VFFDIEKLNAPRSAGTCTAASRGIVFPIGIAL
jgi:hypothetical protein